MLNKINPSIKCLIALFCGIALSFTYSIGTNISIFTLCLAGLLLSKIRYILLIKTLFIASVAAVGLVFTGFFFSTGSESVEISSSIGVPFILPASLYTGIQLATRLYAFVGLGLFFTLTTPRQALIVSLEQQLKMPAKFAYGILAALNLAPLLPFEYHKSVRALQARGKKSYPLSPKLMVPLMIKTIRWSESLAMAMESKGFDEYAERTHYKVITVKPHDYVFIVISLGLLVICLVYF